MVANATVFLKEKREIRERIPLTRFFFKNFRICQMSNGKLA